MPNHVLNKLVITGTRSELEAVQSRFFASAVSKDGVPQAGTLALDFNRLSPEPDEPNDFQRILWRNDQWGTKWNSYERKGEGVKINGNGVATLSCEFLTAWSPPVPVLAKLARTFPSVSITGAYLDECDQPSGTFATVRGELFLYAEDAEKVAREEFGLPAEPSRRDEVEAKLNS